MFGIPPESKESRAEAFHPNSCDKPITGKTSVTTRQHLRGLIWHFRGTEAVIFKVTFNDL